MSKNAAILMIIAAVVLSLVFSWVPWFKTNEHVALWLEGIALVLIFVWDRLDSRQEHKETMEQIQLAKQQSQFTLNSERAWLTANLDWAPGGGRIVFVDTAERDSRRTTTFANLALDIRNDGRTPAWIEAISTGMHIEGHDKQPEQPLKHYIEPIATEKVQRINLTLSCPDKPQGNALLVSITIHYRDIFEPHKMHLERVIDPVSQQIMRLESVRVESLNPSASPARTV